MKNWRINLRTRYVRAIRWASDRIGTSGVVAYVSNGGFIDANTADGLRKCLVDEFSNIYIFHLRGNARTSGEQRRKERDNVFGMGTRTPIAISVLVKNPNATKQGQVHFCDIGDYLTREQKLDKIVEYGSIQGITTANEWKLITPNEHNDWIGQRDNTFVKFISLGDKKDHTAISIFENYSSGVKTNRDAWCYNASKPLLAANVQRMIDFYNAEVGRYKEACGELTRDKRPDPETFVLKDTSKISWTREVYADVGKGHLRNFVPENLVVSMYRPYTKQWMYFNPHFNNCQYQIPRLLPDKNTSNRIISLTGLGTPKSFSAVMTNSIPDIQLHANGQCYPLKIFEVKPSETDSVDLFGDHQSVSPASSCKDGITDEGLKHFVDAYNGANISKEDLFYYVYGLLHSTEYKERYADNLSKELPRIPAVKKFEDFIEFSEAGRKLADLHLNYETVETYPVNIEGGALLLSTFMDSDYRVTQMKFASKSDKSTVIYNHKITMKDIPLEAYEYVVNGKPALEWVMERQAVTTHKDSGIVNDANLWATETMGDAAYPLKLFQRVITVSLETMKIVRGLLFQLCTQHQSMEASSFHRYANE